MRVRDSRPPFAGLANLSEEQLHRLPTPCYLLDEAQLRRNGEILLGVQQRTGCRILLAQKAFSNFDLYPVLAPYLAGTEASGLYESRLGREELPEKENHVFCAAYRADEFAELLQYADHIVFNSPSQLAKFGPAAKAAGKSVGLRLNPECSTQEGHAIYDPCAPGSRLGTTRAQWDAAVQADPALPELLDGLHFHTLCEQDADALALTLAAVEAKFGGLLPRMKWLNFGGGHHITRPGYRLATLEQCITETQKKYGVQVGAHPGLPDLQGFGRRRMAISPAEAEADVMYQIGALKAFCDAAGVPLHHVKPHGALYNMAAKDPALAEAIAGAVHDVDPSLVLYGLAGSCLIRAAEKAGLASASEVFADRTYQDDGSLTPRSQPGAVLTDDEAAISQVLRMIEAGTVISVSGKEVPVRADTVCIHGDSPKALDFARRIRKRLTAEGIEIISFIAR